eukprot:TRINITY_DN9707_c0_g1_i2.p1 TRINITY_DN9707_c0_g1~~TRINITY_DN9707_c0_g1_i2.p1  ORF type:complete len:379 (-),score=48.71 TRINITY_DN9707_c0_g1_i2:38-1174(-)
MKENITLLLLLSSVVLVFSVPLHTEGRWIVDEKGQHVRLACVNWYGADQKDFMVGGLEQQPLEVLVKTIKTLGFNCVRLPWSLQMYIENPTINNRTKLASNLDFLNKPALFILDRVIETLASQEIMIILDNHMSNADWCCSGSDGNGLWYTTNYPASVWTSTWLDIVKRYRNVSMVIGTDLRNELRTGCVNGQCRTAVWGGSDPNTDWHGAAQNLGNQILSINPNLLIFVEGINYALDLTGVRNLPIKLNVADRVVYEAHNYQWDFSFSSYNDFKSKLDNSWGYIVNENIAPLWLGEFGTCHSSVSCVQGNSAQGIWFQYLIQYIKSNDLSWSYWALDGTESSGTGRTYNAEESYGILNMQWSGVKLNEMMEALKTIQ